MPRTAWFLVYLLSAYVIAWASFVFLGLDRRTSGLSAWLAALLLDFATPLAVATAADGDGLTFRLASGHEVFFDTQIAGQTLPLLFAVVIAIAQSLGRRTFALLGGGLVAILILDSLSLTGQVWAAFGDALPKNAAYHVLRIFSIWDEGGWSFLPIFIAALLAAPTIGKGET